MNYFNTFIEVADDSPVSAAEVPPPRNGAKTIPLLQYEMIANHPYDYVQEDVLFCDVYGTPRDSGRKTTG